MVISFEPNQNPMTVENYSGQEEQPATQINKQRSTTPLPRFIFVQSSIYTAGCGCWTLKLPPEIFLTP